MPSCASQPAEPSGGFRKWNRKLHYYLGLYFLFFVWLFALTGLLLNHGSWRFAEFWPNRKITVTECSISVTPAAVAIDTAKQIMRQTGITGEIQWLTTPARASRLDFRVARPGTQYEVKADLAANRATIERTDLNPWGMLRILHTFTGVRLNDPRNERDWVLTTLWAFSMDAVALGLIVMTLSGIIMWFQSGASRIPGMVVLGGGVAVCSWFLVGLAWLNS